MESTIPDQHVIPPELGPPVDGLVGGFVADTTLLTPTGFRPVDSLSPGDLVYALDPQTRLVKLKPVTAVSCRTYDGQLIEIAGRRTGVRVHPDHPILFRSDAHPRPMWLAAGDLTTRTHYRFINRWRRPPRSRLESVDLTELLDDYQICASTSVHGHTFRAGLPEGCDPVQQNQWVGYVFDATTFQAHRAAIEAQADALFIRAATGHHRRPFIFDGDDFIELLGWYVAEGSVYRGSPGETAALKIAQERQPNRGDIGAILERMGIRFTDTGRALRFGSELYGRVFERLAGKGSREKHLPPFVWDLPYDQQALLMETLIRGDGNDNGTYYTASETLAWQVCRLAVDLGMKPRHANRNIWQIYVHWVNDGFTTAKNVRSSSYDGELFQVGVEDYPALMAGRERKLQWVGSSQVT